MTQSNSDHSVADLDSGARGETPLTEHLRDERDFLALQLDGTNELLRDSYGKAAGREAELNEFRKELRELFKLSEQCETEIRRARCAEKTAKEKLAALRNGPEFRMGQTVLRRLRSPLGWLGLPQAVFRRYRKLRPDPKPLSRRGSSGDWEREISPDLQGLILRMEGKSPWVKLPDSRTACEVWTTLFSDRSKEVIKVRVELQGEGVRTGVSHSAGKAAGPGDREGSRKVRCVSGKRRRLFSVAAKSGIIRFRLRSVSKQPCLIRLEVREPATSPASKTVSMQPRNDKILGQAYQLIRKGFHDEAIAFAEAHASEAERPGIHVLRANQALDDDDRWLGHLNNYITHFGIVPVELQSDGPSRFQRLIATPPRRIETGPLVSVIMCAHNVESTLEHAARSILTQTWRPLELIIVDDASTDATAAIARRLMREDSRVRLHCNGVNVGCDVTKSIGAMHAQGEYITSHDADDWAHPERIEQQIGLMLAHGSELKMSRIGIVRMTDSGACPRFYSTTESAIGPMIQAMITCCFDAKFFRKYLGYWDSVRFGADSEMYFRAKRLLGERAKDLPSLGVFMLDIESSESNNPLYGHRGFSPSNSWYGAAYGAWHASLTLETAYTPLPHSHRARLFPAPPSILVADYQVERAKQGTFESRGMEAE